MAEQINKSFEQQRKYASKQHEAENTVDFSRIHKSQFSLISWSE